MTGRNLFTIADYSGLDPEIGSGDKANVFRVDDRQYAPFRQVTGRIEVQF